MLILVLWLATEPAHASKAYVYLDDSFAQQHGRLLLLATAREQIKRKSERGRGRGKGEHVMKELQKKQKKTIAPVL